MEAFLKSGVRLKTKGSSVLWSVCVWMLFVSMVLVLAVVVVFVGGGGGGGGGASYTVSTHDV